VASDAAAGDYFGTSVALGGDAALVGARNTDDAGSDSGAAYVFVRNATSWTQTQKLVASDAAGADYFGVSVALSRGAALVGAYGSDAAANASGSAYVFVRNATSWTEEKKLVASDGAPGAHFGVGVALSGDAALVGAYWDDAAANASGSAYVFVRNAAGWTEEQKLVASDGAPGAWFGHSVALNGDAALVGAFRDDEAGSASGAAYIFARNATNWVEEHKLLASNGAPGDFFGHGVALNGSAALVGSYNSYGAGTASGSAYMFTQRLVDGESCSGDEACASAHCTDGFCCDASCDGPCETCNQVSFQGVCNPLPRGSSPSSDCQGYLCDGDQGRCQEGCRSDPECMASHYCRGELVCLPRAPDGVACIRDAGCVLGHCADGICCDQACGGGCGSCTLAGLEGKCAPLPEGNSGTPACEPYRCNGSDVACPALCALHRDCAAGSHCEEARCQPDELLGGACSEAAACDSGHCSDGICCVASSCAPYRCGPVGACLNACQSSAQCAGGHECNSERKCEVRSDVSNATGGSCACVVNGEAGSTPWRTAWLAALGMLVRLRSRRAGRLKLGGQNGPRI